MTDAIGSGDTLEALISSRDDNSGDSIEAAHTYICEAVLEMPFKCYACGSANAIVLTIDTDKENGWCPTAFRPIRRSSHIQPMLKSLSTPQKVDA